MESIFHLINKSTASGRGPSYWDVASNCGEKRYLTDLHTQIVKDAETNVEEKRLGTYVHALLDMWIKGAVPEGQVLDTSDILPSQWADAVKIFDFIREYFPKHVWGEFLGTEVKFPIDEVHATEILSYFGHVEITGQADALIEVGAQHLGHYEGLGCTLPGPGVYLLDWKTGGARKGDPAARGSFLESIQSKVYPLLARLGGIPVEGMIFPYFVNHAQMRRLDEGKGKGASVQCFYAPWNPIRDQQARAAVNFAREQRNNRTKNPYACILYTGVECPFRTKGLCDGL